MAVVSSKMERKIIKLRYILLPVLVLLVPIYYFIFCLLRYIRTKHQRKFEGVKLICIGNPTLGGSGKTTVVKKLAEELKSRGKNVGIVIRGYKRIEKKEKVVLLENSKKYTSDYIYKTGDEPYMLFSSLNIPVSISSNRVKAIETLYQYTFSGQQLEVIISDDGYQNFSFYKDINILLINLYEFTKRKLSLFPLGNLREPLSSAIKRADYVILTHAKIVPEKILKEVKQKVQKFNKSAKIVTAYYKIKNFVSVYNNKSFSLKEFLLLNNKITICCGIGIPEIFERMLISEGFDIKYKFFYSDHYWYKLKDLKYLRKVSNNYPVVMTNKDAVKIIPLLEKHAMLYFDKLFWCDIKLVFDEGEQLWDELINSL